MGEVRTSSCSIQCQHTHLLQYWRIIDLLELLIWKDTKYCWTALILPFWHGIPEKYYLSKLVISYIGVIILYTIHLRCRDHCAIPKCSCH